MIALRLLIVVLVALLAACGSAPKRDLDYDRLQARLDELEADPQFARLAAAERTLALTLMRRLDVAGGKEHAHLVYLAERRVDIAWIAAQAEQEAAQLAGLEREYAALQLEASRRETATVRDELDRQRRLELVREEEAQRAAAAPVTLPVPAVPPAADAALAERLAALAPVVGLRGPQMTLEDLVFDPGRATLRPEAQAGLDRVQAFVERDAHKAIRIEGHTDATGSVEANRDLSQRRAEAVRDALVARGVAAGRIRVYGLGEGEPVASNEEAEGRALNRRVVIVLENPDSAPTNG